MVKFASNNAFHIKVSCTVKVAEYELWSGNHFVKTTSVTIYSDYYTVVQFYGSN